MDVNVFHDLQWTLSFVCVLTVVNAAEYCEVFCSDGCCGDGCCTNKTAVGVGVAVGSLVGLCLIFMAIVIFVTYQQKFFKKKSAEVAVAKQEFETIDKYNDQRTIKMESDKCTLTITQGGTTKIVVRVSDGDITVKCVAGVRTSEVTSEILNVPPQPVAMPAAMRGFGAQQH